MQTDHPERSKQEVQQLDGAWILDVLLQFALQNTQSVNTPPSQPDLRRDGDHAPPCPAPTSWLKACLNFCRQSTNSSSGGGLERRVRTPSGGQRWKHSLVLTVSRRRRPNRDRSEQEVTADRQEVVMLLPSLSHLQDSSSCSSLSSSCGRARRTPQPPSAVWSRRTQCRPGYGSEFAAKIKVRRTVGLRRSIGSDAVTYQVSEVTTHHVSVHSGGRHLRWPVLLRRLSLLLVCRRQNPKINNRSVNTIRPEPISLKIRSFLHR